MNFRNALIVSNDAGASGRGQRAADHRTVYRCRRRREYHGRTRTRNYCAQSFCRQLETRHAFGPAAGEMSLGYGFGNGLRAEIEGDVIARIARTVSKAHARWRVRS